MNDKELDRLLVKGKKESEKFFSHMNLQHLRRTVGQNIGGLTRGAGGKQKKATVSWPFVLKTAAAAACIILLICTFSVIFSRQNLNKSVTGNSIAQQPISLGSSGKNYLLSFFPVNKPDFSKPSIMTILWELKNGDSSQMVYNSLFEDCDELYPVSTILFAGTDSKMALISTGDSAKGFLHYRLIGGIDNSVRSFFTQDFVPDGKINMQDGILVEQRKRIPDNPDPEAAGSAENRNITVSYIIPYNKDDEGQLFLPVESLRIKVGEHLFFVGSGDNLDVSSQKGMLKKAKQDNAPDKTKEQAYIACSAGEDILLLTENGAYKILYLKVTE